LLDIDGISPADSTAWNDTIKGVPSSQSLDGDHFEMATVMLSSPMAAPTTSVGTPEPVDDDILYEVVDNQIRELPPKWANGRYCACTVFRILSSFAWNVGLGHVENLMLYLLNPVKNQQRRPDVSFVSFGRWPRGRRIPNTTYWDVVPNLAIEVVSPSNSANEVMEKTNDYFEAGVERVWVIYPDFAMIYDYDSLTSVQILTRDQTLDGGTVLPGLQLPLTELFEDESDQEMDASA
jgi:Uma2 family endonuclease